ncbi:hypothetical protein E3U23_12885 [Erythrobacter litoralis]|uniref:hypothetical protein n=1 Tax=Erythrobacter litoralis TaxID=39960 RepID=UPI0024360A8B|nr:hypothetical protein [Erythrobacter litoralis]MDG6080082.1 hypothetical protein [Erythrobacter litoralis]
MFKTLAFAAATLSLAVSAPLAAQDDAPVTKGEAKLAEMLEGRVAGEPSNCIRTFGSRNLQQIDDTALVYRDGDTVWVNYTKSPSSIDDDDYLVIRKFTNSQLCRTDQVTTRDRFGNFFSGVIILDDFIPYRMPEHGTTNAG